MIRLSRRDIAPLKKATRAFVEEACARYAGMFNVTYKRIYVGNARTRWGSCSEKGNLTFNYKLAGLPSDIAEYVVLHEICHLLELNHGKRFWALVATQKPNHKTLRSELRRTVLSFRY